MSARPARSLDTDTDQISPLGWSYAGHINHRRCRTWAVRDFLAEGEVTALVAEPFTGKSVTAACMAVCVVLGEPFFGHAVAEGTALYIALEREADTRERISAMIGGLGGDVPVLGPSTEHNRLDLRKEDAADKIVATIHDVEERTGSKVRLVVVDTYARAMPGGNELDARDVGEIADTLARIANAGPAVLVLHHPPRGGGSTLRGSSALDGAVDRILSLKKKKDVLTLRVEEANSGPAGAHVSFRLGSAVIGRDPETEADITTAVVGPIAEAAAPVGQPPGSKSAEQAALVVEVLRQANGSMTRNDLRNHFRSTKAFSPEKASSDALLRKALSFLEASGQIDRDEDGVWLK